MFSDIFEIIGFLIFILFFFSLILIFFSCIKVSSRESRKEEEQRDFLRKGSVNVNICVCCGREIPEGRSVCMQCERGNDEDGHF